MSRVFRDKTGENYTFEHLKEMYEIAAKIIKTKYTFEEWLELEIMDGNLEERSL